MSFVTMPKEGCAEFIANANFHCLNSESLIETTNAFQKEIEHEYIRGDEKFDVISAKLDRMCSESLIAGTLDVLSNFANFAKVSVSIERVLIHGNDNDGYDVTASFYVAINTRSHIYSHGLERENLEQFESELIEAFTASQFSWTFFNIA